MQRSEQKGKEPFSSRGATGRPQMGQVTLRGTTGIYRGVMADQAGRRDTTSVGSGLQAGTFASAKGLLLEKVPLFALAIASSIVTYAVQQQGGAVSGLDESSLSLRMANALVSYVAYLWNTVWPASRFVLKTVR